jgi:hypothetical protein
LAQPAWYHDFADQRWLYGVPLFWNVVSNLPFAVIDLLRLRVSAALRLAAPHAAIRGEVVRRIVDPGLDCALTAARSLRSSECYAPCG